MYDIQNNVQEGGQDNQHLLLEVSRRTLLEQQRPVSVA